jgi:hypothetical protein
VGFAKAQPIFGEMWGVEYARSVVAVFGTTCGRGRSSDAVIFEEFVPGWAAIAKSHS